MLPSLSAPRVLGLLAAGASLTAVILRTSETGGAHGLAATGCLLCGCEWLWTQPTTVSNARFALRSAALALGWTLAACISLAGLHNRSENTLFLAALALAMATTLAHLAEKQPPNAYRRLASQDSRNSLPPQSLLSLATFGFMGPLVEAGLAEKVTADHLFDLDSEFTAQNLFSLFEYTPSESILPFFLSLMPFFGWQFLLAWLFVCGSLFLELVQPKLFEAILDFVSDTDTVYPPSYGWSLVAYVLLVAVLSPPVKEQYFHRMLVTGAKIRTGLIGAIYAKSLRLSSAARQKFSQGYIQTLQGVDTDAIQLLPRQIFNGLFKANVQLAVVFYLLYQQIGLAFIPGFLIVVLSSPVQVHLMNKSGKQEKLRLEAMDKRIRLMGEALKGMLVVKFNNLNVPMQNSVKAYRIKELTHIRASQVYQALSAAFWQLQPFLIALSCFGTYIVLLGQSLTPTRTFTTLALLRLMNSPMNWLRNLFVQAKRILVSARRIDAFFKAEEIQDVSLDERVENGYIRVMEKDIRRDADRNADAVVVHAAFGSWEKGAAVAVHVDDLQIKQGDFVSVVGQTGEGKSSLVSMLLGELFLESGSVKVCGKIAYVSQQAWILSGTIRDNILFGSAYNDEHYNSVLSQCALLRDLEIWPDGDMTEIGERGITCSGGQKQRISLARAVYARADVYILDDPLSALDAHVAKHIFHAVLGKEGVLAECTRILVTHGIHFLPAVDRILLIKGGQIVEDGDYPKLVELGGEFAKLSKVMEADERKMREAERGASSSSTFPEGEDEATIVSMGEGVHVIDDAPQSAKPAQLVSEEEQSEGSVGWKAYSQYADAFSYQGVLVCLTLCILSKGIEAGASWWLGVWSSETPEDQVSGLIYYFGIYAVFVLVVSFFGSVYTYVLRAVYALKAATVLHDNVLDSIMKAPMSFFDVTPTGRILNRFSKDVDTLCDALPVAVSDTLLELVIVISGIGVCTIATPYYILMVLPLALPYIWLQKRYLGTSRDLRRLHAITRSPIYQLVDECLDGLPTLRAYRMQENFTDRLMRIIDVNNNAWISNLLISRWFDVRIDTVGLLALVISAALCVASKGTVDPALAGLALIYASSTAGYLSFFVQDFCLLEVNIVSVERINEYVDCPQESSIFAAPVNNERSRRSPSEGWPSAGTLEFKNYGTSYRPGLDLVLRELNFTVESRERIGIVGRTGSGKSSLVLALTRILEAAEGAIELDGYNISHINLSDLRKHITVVPQEPILFASSIRENLDPFGIYADDLIWSVLEKVRMKAWAKGLPERLEAPISEGGSNLSVGERQLLCMAKALLQKSRILVLDEATSSIDIKTDELIQKILREEFVDSTILCIAHRINTILDYDKILVLEGGVVKEFNTPDALLSNSESVFYKLCRSHQDHRT